MATTYRAVKMYPLPAGAATSTCPKCQKEVLIQHSYHNNRSYLTDVVLDSMQNKVTARNLFHKCPPGTVQPPLPFTPKLNAAAILNLFTTAAVHLKYPKIRLQTASGQPVVVYRAGARSMYNGQVQVTDGGHFGCGKYFGRIDLEGNFHGTREVTPELVSLLTQLSEDPAGVAARYGKLTGNCCFCGLKLSDKRSTDVGYGPICADHYGLAWG